MKKEQFVEPKIEIISMESEENILCGSPESPESQQLPSKAFTAPKVYLPGN